MKIFRLFTIAAAALILSACSSEDTAQNNNPVAGRQMHFTATIAAPNSGAGTRTEYTEDTENKKITVAWKVDDEIALVHDKVMDVVKVKTVNADGSATIDGTITSATDEATVQLVYPAARVSAVNSDGNPEFYEAVSGKLLTQDGTLTYIQNNIDFREGEGQLSVNGTEVTLNAAVDMVSTIAIWKLTLQNDAATPAALAATKVTIMSGSDELASTAVLTTGKSTLYLAVPADGTSANICITAATADNDYFYMKEGVALATGKYYQSTVQMTKGAHLAFLSADYEAKDGETLTGTLASNVKISIADGATVTLKDVQINESGTCTSGDYAGITSGDNSIINLEGTNTVKGFADDYPGIYVPDGKTLTIQGTGSLTASSGMDSYAHMFGAGIGGGSGSCGNITIKGGNITATGGGAGIGSGYNQGTCGDITISGGTVSATGGKGAAGIGSGYQGKCGDILISGGTVSATGGDNAAGIGSGAYGNCGNILISGGTVEATGGANAAAIGSGNEGSCGNITITTGVTQVTATKVSGFETVGRGGNGSCTNVTIGGTVYWNGSAYQNGGDTYLLKSTIFYPVPAPIALSAVTSSQLGWIVGNDGKAYAEKPLPAGVDAVAMIFYVGTTGDATYNHGLALALADEGKMEWSTAGTTCSGKNTSTPITGAKWLLASKDQWDYMMGANGAGSWKNLKDKAGLINDFYWSSSPGSDDDEAKGIDFYGGNWSGTLAKTGKHYVRACLAF